MSIYYYCGACKNQWIGDLECPACGNRELKGPNAISDGGGPDDVVEEAIEATYKALCNCDDVYGDNPFCPACFPVDS